MDPAAYRLSTHGAITEAQVARALDRINAGPPRVTATWEDGVVTFRADTWLPILVSRVNVALEVEIGTITADNGGRGTS